MMEPGTWATAPGHRGLGLQDAIVGSQPHRGTELGKAVKPLLSRDRLIVITDEQGQGSVPQMKGYMMNVASNRNGVGYGQWLQINGRSDKVLNYIVKYEAIARNDA
jgi:60 kDa SS-A/Ro ribonucleoprotein